MAKHQIFLVLKTIIVGLIVIILDQSSKRFIIDFFSTNGTFDLKLFPMLNFVWVENRGFGFGALSSVFQGQWQPIIISIIVTIVIIFLGIRNGSGLWLPLSMICGGAISNIIDRMLYGFVFDFIDLFWKKYHYPAFNIADAFIVVGAVLIAIAEMKKQKFSATKTKEK